MSRIDKLIEVDVRELWTHEQSDFSNWLAKDENLEYLNDIIGGTLVDARKEVYVGPYRCDIVAIDETSNITVVIENQLTATNHEHLGKIITYASGLDAKVLIWIVTEATEPHRAAVEWLNNNSNNNVNLFLVEIHAYKIGDSDPAPKFEVIEKPNDFIKLRKLNNNDTELNRIEAERLLFWQQFNEILIKKGKPFNVNKAKPEYWYNIAMGTQEAVVSITLNSREGNINVEVCIKNNKKLFDDVIKQKSTIEKNIGLQLKWNRLDGKKASSIKYSIPGLNFDNHKNYDTLMDQTIDVAVKMRDEFRKYMNCNIV